MTFVDAALSTGRKPGQIKLFGPEAFASMRKAGQLAAEALDMMVDLVKPGVTTEFLDKTCFEFAMDHKAYPAPLHYRGFTKSICTSINHVVCHGIPNEKPLREGDIVNIDITLVVDGWHGDSSRMYGVGAVPRRAERLVDITYECLMRGIAAVKPGATTGDIGFAIQSYAEQERCSVVRDFCGHGLGQLFHDEPNILHYDPVAELEHKLKYIKAPDERKMVEEELKLAKKRNITLRSGMLFTIEPMINLGRPEVKVLGDGWTAVTRDRSLSAQFEHTIGVTETGCEIFTLSPKGLDKPPIISQG